MSTNFCPRCGTARDATRRTCAECGYFWAPAAPRALPRTPWWVWALVAVGIVGVLGCGLVGAPFVLAFLHALLTPGGG
jgi:ribosomal protein L37E